MLINVTTTCGSQQEANDEHIILREALQNATTLDALKAALLIYLDHMQFKATTQP